MMIQMIGIVSQEPSIFSGSIRDNIDLGRGYSQSEIETVCTTAYAHHFIMKLDKV